MTQPDLVFTWHETPIPASLPVTRVHGWLLCPDSGRVLLQEVESGRFTLPGGSLAPEDVDLIDTLIREGLEESQVIIKEAVYLGYEEARGPGYEPAAMVRMVGIIDSFQARRPDPDGGRLYRRRLTSLAQAPSLLGWGESGETQAQAARRVAERRWHLPVSSPEPDSYRD